MTILIGKCMNCGKIYGNKILGTLESIYNLEPTHKCKGEAKNKETMCGDHLVPLNSGCGCLV